MKTILLILLFTVGIAAAQTNTNVIIKPRVAKVVPAARPVTAAAPTPAVPPQILQAIAANSNRIAVLNAMQKRNYDEISVIDRRSNLYNRLGMTLPASDSAKLNALQKDCGKLQLEITGLELKNFEMRTAYHIPDPAKNR